MGAAKCRRFGALIVAATLVFAHATPGAAGLADSFGRDPEDRFWPAGVSRLGYDGSGRHLCAFVRVGVEPRAYVRLWSDAYDLLCDWTLNPGRDVYTIMQMTTGRYLDAHTNGSVDWRSVTRREQWDDSQLWYVVAEGDAYRIQQARTGRFLDAHENGSVDFSVVTRRWQPDDTQRWNIERIEGGQHRFQQSSSGRWLDAYDDETVDFMAVTRPKGASSQMWNVEYIGREYTIVQESTGRYLDAELVKEDEDWISWVFARPRQTDNSQRWICSRPRAAIASGSNR